MLREVKRLRAVRKQRRKAFGQIQLPPIELHEKSDQVCGSPAFIAGSALNLSQKIGIRKLDSVVGGDCAHASGIPSSFGAAQPFVHSTNGGMSVLRSFNGANP